jgi:hypothetical protein
VAEEDVEDDGGGAGGGCGASVVEGEYRSDEIERQVLLYRFVPLTTAVQIPRLAALARDDTRFAALARDDTRRFALPHPRISASPQTEILPCPRTPSVSS